MGRFYKRNRNNMSLPFPERQQQLSELANPYKALSYLFLLPTAKEQARDEISPIGAYCLGKRALQGMRLPETASLFYAEQVIDGVFLALSTRSPYKNAAQSNELANTGTVHIAQMLANNAHVQGDTTTRDALASVLEKRHSDTMKAAATAITYFAVSFDSIDSDLSSIQTMPENVGSISVPTDALQTS